MPPLRGPTRALASVNAPRPRCEEVVPNFTVAKKLPKIVTGVWFLSVSHRFHLALTIFPTALALPAASPSARTTTSQDGRR
jgi:hypothetical protein